MQRSAPVVARALEVRVADAHVEAKTGYFVDRFVQAARAGRAIGSRSADGILRRGVDREKVIGIDHGALRIEPLVKPGWGRSGLAYGPYQREPGLTFHTLVLNGHNISRTEPLPDGFRMRMWRWALGPEERPPLQRLLQWLANGNKRHMWRRLRQWVRSGSGLMHWPWIEESLAVGWFASEAPALPLREGCNLAMHAVVPEGGELWARVGLNAAPTLRGLQNLPLYYTVVLREAGAAYYVSSPIGVPGIGSFPKLRPVGIDTGNRDSKLYAAIHQSVLGEIGFRVDTRVYGTQVTKVAELGAWYGTAHGADALTGKGALASSTAEVGGTWTEWEGRLRRSERGAVGETAADAAVLALPGTTGLLHALIDCADQPVECVALIWRAADARNYWSFEIGSGYGQLVLVEDGRRQRLARVQGRHLPPHTVSAVQIADDGAAIRVHLNGRAVFGSALHDTRLGSACGAGLRIVSPAGNAAVRSFEAHPREVHIDALAAFGGPSFALGERVVAADAFEGPPTDLADHVTAIGGLRWRRDIGRGTFMLMGNGRVKVQASAQQPCPGRTAYMIDWPDPRFADIQASITPAGRSIGTREKGRSGLIFWQDEDNFLILSAFVEDWPAMSIAAFFRVKGFEELFDAVWTNVGSRMHWGETHDLRVAFDGQAFTTYLNGEAILYRALTDVYPDCGGWRIERVGLVANWEWGNDTGSTFARFVGRTRP
jgi:hypothetical protein